MCTITKKTPNNYLPILFILILVFTLLFPNSLYAVTIYTPEGRSVTASTPSEMSQGDIDYCHWYIQVFYIDPYDLNAVRIGNASQTYNCHGYAWSLSEGDVKTWIQDDEEKKYFSDDAWSNDSQPSYLTASESEATHSWYTDNDHSARKIQNSYPAVITGGRNYISKWGMCGLYQHAKNHDCYYLKQNLGHSFKKLKTTHYGTLSSYPKTWVGVGGKTHTITGNVSVPSGVTLKIKSGATVNLNSYTITSTGGTIIVQGGATINPDIRLIAGGSIKRLYLTIASAISDATSGQTVAVGAGTHFINSDITLSSGITLDIAPGATIIFDGSYQIKVYGTLKADNTNFTKSGSVSQWMGLRFYSGSDNSYLKNCSVNYARFGVHISNSDIDVYQCTFRNCIVQNIQVSGSSAEPTIEKCDIQDNCGTALLITNNANPIVKNNKFNSSDYAISIYNSYGSFDNNLIGCSVGDGVGYGVNIYGSTSAPEFTSSLEGEGNLFDNCNRSHVAIKGGNPNFGVWYYGDGGYNTFTRNFGDYYMENWTSTTISAQLNWWELTNPSSNLYGSNYIQWHPPLYYPPSSVGPLWKTNIATDPAINEFIKISQMIKSHEFGNAISSIKSFNVKNRDHILVHQILFELFSTIHKEDMADKQLEFMNYVTNSNFDEPSKKVARGFLADYYASQGNMAEAEKIIFTSPQGSLSERELLMDLITKYTLANDPDNANRVANIMRSRHHDRDVEQDIKVALESFTDVADNEDRPISITLPDDKIVSISPNPFNFTTSISYSITEPGRTEIRIFDILGREVRTLINNHQDVGLYSVQWNGKNNDGLELPSGIYIFTFKTKSAYLKTKLTFLK